MRKRYTLKVDFSNYKHKIEMPTDDSYITFLSIERKLKKIAEEEMGLVYGEYRIWVIPGDKVILYY